MKLIRLDTNLARVACVVVAVVFAVVGVMSVRAFFVRTLATRLDLSNPAAGEGVEWLVDAGDRDPSAHTIAAVYYEQTFEASDVGRSLQEYQKAAELSPNDYVLWLSLARARSRAGDADGADAAFRRARELAPSYADVQWAYGNFLVRQGRDQEGFPLIAQAATANPQLAASGVSLMLQLNGGDAARAHELLGNSPVVNAALASTLVSLKKYDEALAAWREIPMELRGGKYGEASTAVLNAFVAQGKFRIAAEIVGDLTASDAAKPTVGHIMNGGFEEGVKLRRAGTFEWQIGDAAEPQVGLSESQKHSGKYGLAMTFTAFKPGSRDLSQVIAVEPGAHYHLEVWYKNSVKAEARFRWNVLNASTQAVIASTDTLPPADWSLKTVSFQVPSDIDGIRVALGREGCTGPSCPASGTIIFDDIALVRE